MARRGPRSSPSGRRGRGRRRGGRAPRTPSSRRGRFLRGSTVPVHRTYGPVEAVAWPRTRSTSAAVTGVGVDAPRHQPQPARVEPGGDALVERWPPTGSSTSVGVGAGPARGRGGRSAGRAWSSGRGRAGTRGRGRSPPAARVRRRHGDAGGVDHVDRAGRPLDRRASAVRCQPRTARAGAAAAPAPGSAASTGSGGGCAVPGADADQVELGARRAARGPPRGPTRAVPPGTRCQHCSRVTATRSGRSRRSTESSRRHGYDAPAPVVHRPP